MIVGVIRTGDGLQICSKHNEAKIGTVEFNLPVLALRGRPQVAGAIRDEIDRMIEGLGATVYGIPHTARVRLAAELGVVVGTQLVLQGAKITDDAPV